jgi:competence protein ComEC
VRHPAAPLAIALLLGTAAGLFVWVPRDVLATAVWAGWVCAAAAFAHRDARVFAVAAVLTAVACGWALAVSAVGVALDPEVRRTLRAVRGTAAVSDDPSDPVVLSGRLVEDVTAGEDGSRLSLDVERVRVDGREHATSGGVLLTVAGTVTPAQALPWRRGRLVSAPALLRRPARYLNPGVPDHEIALLRRGTALVGTVKSALLVEVVGAGSWADEAAASVRAWARAAIERDIGRYSARSAAIVRAILIGDRTGLDDETQERLQAAGTYHVLAISGGNVAILAAVMVFALRATGARSPTVEIVAAVALVAYAWLVGGGASVVRATVMAVTWLGAYAVDHRSHPYNALSVAACCGLVVHPLGVFDPGAWLTYGATCAIVIAAGMSSGRLQRRAAWVRAAAALFFASVAAELALFPVSAFVFSRVTAAGLVLNFAAIPLMTVVQVGAMATLAAGAVATVPAVMLGYVTHLAASGLVESGRLVDLVPWLTARLPPPGVWTLAGYYAGWAGVLGTRAAGGHPRLVSRVRLLGAAVTAVSGFWILAAPQPWWTMTPGELRVLFIDVGQGDAAILRCPNGASLLVDAGGAGGSRFDVGRRVVEPAVWAFGVRRLDYLVVTHGDADHMNGAAAVARDFAPREIWEGIPVPPHGPLVELRAIAAARRAGWRAVQRGDRLAIGDVTVIVHHPPPAQWERQRVRNDDSVVIEVRYGAISIVLPGDVEATGERDVAGVLEAAPVRVLEAPHHGSASSGTEVFLRAARPVLGIVSAGRGNRFGHPHRAVLERFAAAGCPMLRTDRDGAILLRTDGRELRVETFSGRSMRLAAPSGPPR